MLLLQILFGLAGIIVFGLLGWRLLDHHADRIASANLLAHQPTDPEKFSMQMVADLPDPVRRFFAFAIEEGTPLFTVARFTMRGEFAMGTKDAPNYLPMKAWQVLAAPVGFVWKMSAGSGVMRVSGSDSGEWTRFWLAGLLPVARLGGDSDHARAAFGRYVAEAVFWTPAALLPGPDVAWQAIDADTARVTVRHGGLEQSVDVMLGPDGRPDRVVMLRWSDANPQKTYQLQPFGGYLSDFRNVGGFNIPMRVEAGNFFDTAGYFPFFKAEITEFEYPVPGS